jgi:hypothetical protein
MIFCFMMVSFFYFAGRTPVNVFLKHANHREVPRGKIIARKIFARGTCAPASCRPRIFSRGEFDLPQFASVRVEAGLPVPQIARYATMSTGLP